jgi:hypothetical protein
MTDAPTPQPDELAISIAVNVHGVHVDEVARRFGLTPERVSEIAQPPKWASDQLLDAIASDAGPFLASVSRSDWWNA